MRIAIGKIAKLAAVLVVGGILFASPAAQAFEIGFGFSANPMDMAVGGDLAIRYGDVVIHSQAGHDEEWGKLRNADEFAHNLHLEAAHACLYVKKIEALLRQMYENLEHYKTYSNPRLRAEAIAAERASIRQWEAELKTARKACRKGAWY